jgi:hypothetical protein
LEFHIEEASAKARTGPPQDSPEDYVLPTWAGVLPLKMSALAPVTDPRSMVSEVPDYVERYGKKPS